MLIVGKDRNKIDICNGYSLKDCQFDKLNYHNKTDSENVEYRDCIFKDSNVYYENFAGAVFRDCIFVDTVFLTLVELDEKSSKIDTVQEKL